MNTSARIKKAQARLVKASRALVRLEEKVDAFNAPVPQTTKQVPAFFSASFQFAWGQRENRRSVIKNGGSDVELYGLTYFASKVPGNTLSAGEEVGLVDTPIGLLDPRQSTFAAEPYNLPDFEFAWDYRVLRDQQTYLNRANSFFGLSRESLGRTETQRLLDFREAPQVFEAGGLIQFEVEPLAYAPIANTDTIYLQLVAFGVRNGVMYEVPR